MTPDELRVAYQVVLKSVSGEKVIKDLEARFHIDGTTFQIMQTKQPTEKVSEL